MYNVVSNVTYAGLSDEDRREVDVAKEIIDLKIKDKALQILNIADTGIVDFSLSADGNVKESIIEQLQNDSSIKLLLSKINLNQLFFTHIINGERVEFDFSQESEGTKKLFLKLKDIIEIVDKGGIFIFDEIDSRLHFKIVEYIVSLFKSSLNAQLICSSHSPNIIDSSFDAKTLWFTQKENGVTSLYSAYDFEDLKKDMSLQKLYEIGRFGAVPKTFYPDNEE